MNRIATISSLIMVMTLAAGGRGGDCPRFRGPAGDGTFSEAGLLKTWPQGGPKMVWSAKGLGQGYSSAVIANDTVYTTGMDEQRQGHLFAYALDGALKWKTPYGPELEKRGPSVAGTRATPTIDGNRVFLMTGFGKLITFDAVQGQVLRTVDLVERFGPKQAQFGFAESVLVEGQKVICAPGGTDASLVALDKTTGATLWQTKGLSQPTGYCPARPIEHHGRRLILTMLAQGAVAVEADTGAVVWQHDYPHRAGVQPNPPLYREGMVYLSSGMGAGGAMLALTDAGPGAAPKWTDKTLDCQMQGTVLIDGYIYGTAQSGNRGLVCLQWQTGKVMWNAPVVGMGVVVAADGMLYIYAQNGTMHLVKPNPETFEPVSQFAVSEGTDEHWAHPTIAHGRLYIRRGDVVMAYDVRAGS